VYCTPRPVGEEDFILVRRIDELHLSICLMVHAGVLFAADRTIGAPMISLCAVPDFPKAAQQHLYFIRFEDLIERPAACMLHNYAWLGLPRFEINPEKLAKKRQRIRTSIAGAGCSARSRSICRSSPGLHQLLLRRSIVRMVA
jgi:hypothetical protein